LFEYTYSLGYNENEDYFVENIMGIGEYELIENEEYQVTVNGNEYTCECFYIESDNAYGLGNPGFLDEDLMNDIPFIIMFGKMNNVKGHAFYPAEEPETLTYYNVSIKGLTGKIEKIPKEYLYQPDWK
jgi:hypothetical protein